MTKAMKRTYDGLAGTLRTGWRGVMWLDVHKRRGEERKRPDTAATLMSRRFMSCWSAERKPWLILGKTIWAGVCEVKRRRRLEEDQVPEEGEGRKAEVEGRKANAKEKKTLLESVHRPSCPRPGPAPSAKGQRNPHFSQEALHVPHVTECAHVPKQKSAGFAMLLLKTHPGNEVASHKKNNAQL